MTAISHAPASIAPTTTTTSPRPRAAARWAGRILTAIPVAFLTFDAAIKFTHIQPVTETMATLGWPVGLAPVLGALLLACLALYLFPPTAALGAVLLTGYLGGAVATHVRVGNPLFSHILFPTYVGAPLWAGLLLRDRRVRALIPFRGPAA